MKNRLCIILAMVIFIAGFTACGKTPVETKTDTSVDSEVVSQGIQTNSTEQEKKQNFGLEEQQAKPNFGSTPAKQTESTTNQGSATTITPEEIHGDIGREYPNFVSMDSLQTWLEFGSGAYESERRECLTQSSKGGMITFYQPSEELLKFVSLDQIEVHTPSQAYTFDYSFADGKKLSIVVENAQIPGFYENNATYLDNKKQGYLTGKKGCGYYQDPQTGIEFYWDHGDFYTHIVWMQYGLVHRAMIAEHDDVLDNILPYLVLEQVTVPLNSDHVTQ